ncbi:MULTISPECIES: pyrroloquinoline quinone precursor peptide PqqA [unclassified Streptomyces]|nr:MULTISPECIES: pyrroloquinoline quinone precursor peptide PqqA [unclassified Streptomyces]MED7953896.1 pyrroloquinoline quinone precursor peptide PqqA [Streptomyces sp. BE303]MEE1825116.1 pyrroloquinoline quinone precursor peptide PqqA [Streptomyces sp. BE20]
MKSTLAPQPVTTAAVPAPPAAAKPAWSAPAVECHRTGAEVTAYAARTTR